MMRRIIAITILMTTSATWAQLGVNTLDVTSTLTVDGSISCKYNQISLPSYSIKDDDCTITYIGRSSEGVFLLPDTEKDNKRIIGRFYQIKNLSDSKNLTVNTQKSNQYLRYGGSGVNNTVPSRILLPGESISIVSNKEGGWDLLLVEHSRMISKTTDWNTNVTENSVVRLGNLSVRIKVQIEKGSLYEELAYLQFKYEGSHYNVATILFRTIDTYKSENFRSLFREKKMETNKWYFMNNDEGKGVDYFRITTKGMAIVYITIGSTNEIFRVTSFTVMNDNSIPVNKKINITIEKVN